VDNTRFIIEKLHKHPIKSNEAREFLAQLYQKRREKYVPNWYLLRMKILCQLFEFDDMKDVVIPNEIDGIFVYYALSMKEMYDIAGHEAMRDYAYKNMWWTPDDHFVASSARRYARDHQEYKPQFAIMFEDLLVFVSKERYDDAMRKSISANAESESGSENAENLVVDKTSE